MEDMAGKRPVSSRLPNADFWQGKRVFITGHTGFKGGWLTLWLQRLGANICGYSLAPPTNPSLFDLCHLDRDIDHHMGDVRDGDHLMNVVAEFKPEIVLHLAAQPLVRESYARPVETFDTNIMGTVHLLNTVRRVSSVAVAVIVTSDKVYAEAGIPCRHREEDRLGGLDPYSASKACAELVVDGFASSCEAAIATVRSGNVIGGGDWARDRLVVDLIQGLLRRQVPSLRKPRAIRPWQHVLDPLCGYLIAAEHLWDRRWTAPAAWNFGPDAASEITVVELAQLLCDLWGGNADYRLGNIEPDALHEAADLRLDSSRARHELGWHPVWPLRQALKTTVDWFQAFASRTDMRTFTLGQIESYCETAYE